MLQTATGVKPVAAHAVSRAFSHLRFDLCGGIYTASIFGKPDNWSLSLLGNPETQEEYRARLGDVLEDLQVGKALAPVPTAFNAQMIDKKQLTTEIEAGARILYRNAQRPADGVTISPGEAFVISPGGCPITVLTRRNFEAACLHTGRNCIIDRDAVLSPRKGAGRRHFSVIEAGLESLGVGRRDQAQSVRVKVLWSLPARFFPHPLDHPRHAEFNLRMREYVGRRWGADCVEARGNVMYPDLPRIIRAQCIELGVPHDHIDLSHAYLHHNEIWSEGAAGAPRNLVVVARHS